MSLESEDARLELIDRVIKQVREKFSSEEAGLIEAFINNYYLSVPAEDLSKHSVLDLYGAILSHWHFVYQRLPGESKVRVYNPQLEQNGWQSTHTIIEISHDDMPFLIDSIRLNLANHDINIHFMIYSGGMKLERDSTGKILKVLPIDSKQKNAQIEAPIYMEIDKQSDPEVLDKITRSIKAVLADIRLAVKDWRPMREQLLTIIENLKIKHQDNIELEETVAFLQWMAEDNFTFLGYCEFSLDKNDKLLKPKLDTALGILSNDKLCKRIRRNALATGQGERIFCSRHLLMTGKTGEKSNIHRPAYLDFIAIKLFDGDVAIGEQCFIGLYTSVAYNSSPKHIPLMRSKVSQVIELGGRLYRGHAQKALMNILETMPRDDIFHASISELYEIATGILHIQERQIIKLFIRKDAYGNFFSCLVFVPRERFNSELRECFQAILLEELGGHSVEFSTRFSESILARIHYLIRIDPNKEIPFKRDKIEEKLVEASRTWVDNLKSALTERWGEEKALELDKKYGKSFPASYIETFSARNTVLDIEHIEKLSECDVGDIATCDVGMSLYRPIEDSEDSFRFKLFRKGLPISLSDVVPMLENLGVRIINERPYQIKPRDSDSVWINDYRLHYPKGESLNLETVKDIFQEAFAAVWTGKAENDGFNRLVLVAKLSWREIAILRAYYKYLWQTGLGFSQNFVEDALYANSDISKKLIDLFIARFHPDKKVDEDMQFVLRSKVENCLEAVKSLTEDLIIRRYLDLIFATVRTNCFQYNNKHLKSYFSFKIDSKKVPELPLPKPLFEIFVYSTDVEGIHLRAAKVARGGIRWSDRREDFRTEVLGLMKAQQVKNAVIVPLGAKGGFVVKNLKDSMTREERQDEVIHCYKTFIRGLLDITDNRQRDEIIPPENMVRYDEDDPYLVVAADKGTATFSDIANEVAQDYNFWLGDAFASGGSRGYDHKKMGITARGAWESVKMHFQSLGHDTQSQPFTVIGIGDMAGDVFGNGMLLSKHIKLLAAFNHLHIFVDPNPDPSVSYEERKRLFSLPRSSWTDYNKDLISKGGGVFWRSAKYIDVTDEIKQCFGITKKRIVPNEFIRAILTAQVDLLWNGGIGTFVKCKSEVNSEVGDRSNDAIRVNAENLQCRVVAEGGNLGFTHLARVAYSKKNGLINTDAIDNSSGVNCSDNEVNIKVLLNDPILSGDLTLKQRNELLVEMQEEVAELVLTNNRKQNEAISVTVASAVESLQMHDRLISFLERTANLNREVEFLPSKEEINIRKTEKTGLTRPEIAVVMAYVKILLKNELLHSSFPEDPYVHKELKKYFPVKLQQNFSQYMTNHQLKREIIATQVSNLVVDEMGITYVHRLKDETGSSTQDIVKAYLAVREIFEYETIKKELHVLNGSVPLDLKINLLQELVRLLRRATRWFLRNRRGGLEIDVTIQHFKPKMAIIQNSISHMLKGFVKENYDKSYGSLLSKHLPDHIAAKIACFPAMFSTLDIVEASTTNNVEVLDVASVYFHVGARLELGWFRELIKAQPISNHWEALARAAFRDDVDRQQRNLAIAILGTVKSIEGQQTEVLVDTWLEQHQVLLDRWEYFIGELKSSVPQFTMFAVALRELLDLSQTIMFKSSMKSDD